MTGSRATFDALRAGLAAGQVTQVLDDLLQRLTPSATQGASAELARFRREALLHRSTMARVAQQRREGAATSVDEQQVNRVAGATFKLIEEIERRSKDSPIWSAPPRLSPTPDTEPAAGPDEDIFISYKREDRHYVEPLMKVLRERGWSVFWDPLILPGTANWDMLLERKLKAAKCILVVWSRRAAESEFVRTEAHYGRNNRSLVAVTIDGTVPATFALSQTVDLSGWSGAEADARIGDVLNGVAEMLK